MFPQSRIALLETYLVSDPENPRLLAELIELLLRGQQLELAWEYAQRGLPLADKSPQLAYWVNTAALANKYYEQVITQLTAMMPSGETELWQLHNLMYAQLHAGQYQALLALAANHYQQVLSHLPTRIVLARAYYLTGELQLAYNLLVQAAEMATDNSAELYGLLSLITLDLGRNADAEHYSDRALTLDPLACEALITKAALALAAFDAPSAYHHSSLVLDIYGPEIGRAQLILAQALLIQNQFAQAQLHFQRAAEQMVNHQGTWLGLAWTELLNNQLAAAVPHFAKALELDPNFAEAQAGVAIAALLNDEMEKCQYHNQRALRLDPRCFTARYVSASLLARAGQHQDSKQMMSGILNSPLGEGVETIQQRVIRHLAQANEQ